jgi:thymidylate kinase
MSRPIIISLEGNIGAGKTTILEKLSQKLSSNQWVFLREPVHIWDTIRDAKDQTILSKFYNLKEDGVKTPLTSGGESAKKYLPNR